MVELVVEDTTRRRSSYYHVITQEHLDFPHAAVIDATGFRVALFRGETWDGCREAAMEWVERQHELGR